MQTKAKSFEDISWVSVWSYLSLHVSNKSEFFSRHLLRLSLKLCKFMSFKQNRILMNTFVEPQFEVMQVYEFQTKTNLYQDISWVSVSSYLGLRVSKKTEFLWRHLLSRSLKLSKFTTFKVSEFLWRHFLIPSLKLC